MGEIALLKFLHIADVHFDTKFHSRKEVLRKKLRDHIRKAFSNAVDLCIKENVNGLLIAGDLFDNDRLSFKTEQFLIEEFNRLREKNIPVFYATGNHDPGQRGYRVNEINWPDNVHIFKDDKIEEVYIKDREDNKIGKIISCGHKTNRESKNLIKEFPVKMENIPHIGLVHTMVTNTLGVKNHDRYLPCTKEDLESKNYDYWALGHIHTRQKISENCDIYYPGNIQGRNPRETGEKGGLFITIDDNGIVKVDFIPLSPIKWHILNIGKLEDIKDYSQLREHMETNIREYIDINNLKESEVILRVELEGRAYLKKELQTKEDIDVIIEDLLSNLNLLDLEIKTDNLKRIYDISDYKEGNHVLATTLKYLENIEDDEFLVERLLNMELANKIVKSRKEKLNYFYELMKNLDEEAMYRMVGDKDENI